MQHLVHHEHWVCKYTHAVAFSGICTKHRSSDCLIVRYTEVVQPTMPKEEQ